MLLPVVFLSNIPFWIVSALFVKPPAKLSEGSPSSEGALGNPETSNGYGDSFDLLLPWYISLYMSRQIFTWLVVVFGGENIIFKWLIISWGFNYTNIGYIFTCCFFWNVLQKFDSVRLFNNLSKKRFYFHTTFITSSTEIKNMDIVRLEIKI